MKEFFKNHKEDIIVYSFGGLMVVAGIMICVIILA